MSIRVSLGKSLQWVSKRALPVTAVQKAGKIGDAVHDVPPYIKKLGANSKGGAKMPDPNGRGKILDVYK